MMGCMKWALAAAMALSASGAQATIISVFQSQKITMDTLVINNGCADESDGPAATVIGCLNNDHAASGDVKFFSNEPLIFGPSGAKVGAADGRTNTLTIDPVNFSLERMSLVVNVRNPSGWLQFCDNDNCSGQFFGGRGFTYFAILFGGAADFLTVNTEPFELGAEVIGDIRQVRLAAFGRPQCDTRAVCGIYVPEPSSGWLLLAGLLALAGITFGARPRLHGR